MSVGSFKTTEGGVNWSRGRGAAKVTILLDFKQLEKWARKTAQDEARLWTSAYSAACSGLKKKFLSVVKKAGGVEGVPKFKDFEDFTKSLRAIRGKTAPMGGILAERDSVGAWKRNGYQIIGWKDYLEQVAVRFQDGGTNSDDKYFADNDYRRMWHRLGIRVVPEAYAHNERKVLPEPFGSYVDRYLEEWARGAYYKKLARLMVKNGGFAV